MNAHDRRALFAYLVVACACVLLMGQGARSSSLYDVLVGRSAAPSAAVADPVSLTPRADRPRTPDTDRDVDQVVDEDVDQEVRAGAPTGTDDTRRGGGTPGAAGGGPDSLPPRAQGQGRGGGNPPQAGGPRSGPGKGHGSRARVDDDGTSGTGGTGGRQAEGGGGPGGAGQGKGGQGRGKGHQGKGHQGKGNQGKGSGNGQGTGVRGAGR